eukprot:7380968-Prymnesium_polylepis.1
MICGEAVFGIDGKVRRKRTSVMVPADSHADVVNWRRPDRVAAFHEPCFFALLHNGSCVLLLPLDDKPRMKHDSPSTLQDAPIKCPVLNHVGSVAVTLRKRQPAMALLRYMARPPKADPISMGLAAGSNTWNNRVFALARVAIPPTDSNLVAVDALPVMMVLAGPR